jgi:hypothetical protein
VRASATLNQTSLLAGLGIAFLGKTEPGAARPGRDVPVSNTLSRPSVGLAVNGFRFDRALPKNANLRRVARLP